MENICYIFLIGPQLISICSTYFWCNIILIILINATFNPNNVWNTTETKNCFGVLGVLQEVTVMVTLKSLHVVRCCVIESVSHFCIAFCFVRKHIMLFYNMLRIHINLTSEHTKFIGYCIIEVVHHHHKIVTCRVCFKHGETIWFNRACVLLRNNQIRFTQSVHF